MILISKTYEIITPESAENGDAEERGFVFEDQPFTFRELVRLMGEFRNCSAWPARGETCEWLSSYPSEDFRTGESETESIHFSRLNPPRMAKYWKKAMRAAGILKTNR